MAMPAPLVVPTYTIEDLERFPDDGNRYELLAGVLLVTPAPIPGHQIVIARLLHELFNYLKAEGLAHAVGPGAVETGEDTHLEPDILVFPASEPINREWSAVRRWWLAAEVFSRSSKTYDRDYKRNAYLALGVEEVWLVDWVKKVVFVSRRGGTKDAPYEGQLDWHPAAMAAALTIDLKKIFDGLDHTDDWGS